MTIADYKVYIPISDPNLWVLEILSKMYTKYWPKQQQFVVMGFSPPSFNLPPNWEFVSLAEKQEGGASHWTHYIYNYLSNIEDEYVIFSLEDFVPVDHFRDDIFKKVYNDFISAGNIGRFELGWDIQISVPHREVKKYGDFSVLEADQFAQYRISTQTGMWKREYLLRFLNNYWSPWQFEVNGSTLSSAMDDYKVIGCHDPNFASYPARWIHKGAISRYHPEKFNVLGLKVEDIRELVSEGYLNESTLQWGQWQGRVPGFFELGGYNFHPSRMPLHREASPTNWKEYDPTYSTREQ